MYSFIKKPIVITMIALQELREDNNLLSDGKVKLEEQVAITTKRLESLLDDLVRLQNKLDETSQVIQSAIFLCSPELLLFLNVLNS